MLTFSFIFFFFWAHTLNKAYLDTRTLATRPRKKWKENVVHYVDVINVKTVDFVVETNGKYKEPRETDDRPLLQIEIIIKDLIQERKRSLGLLLLYLDNVK